MYAKRKQKPAVGPVLGSAELRAPTLKPKLVGKAWCHKELVPGTEACTYVLYFSF